MREAAALAVLAALQSGGVPAESKWLACVARLARDPVAVARAAAAKALVEVGSPSEAVELAVAGMADESEKVRMQFARVVGELLALAVESTRTEKVSMLRSLRANLAGFGGKVAMEARTVEQAMEAILMLVERFWERKAVDRRVIAAGVAVAVAAFVQRVGVEKVLVPPDSQNRIQGESNAGKEPVWAIIRVFRESGSLLFRNMECQRKILLLRFVIRSGIIQRASKEMQEIALGQLLVAAQDPELDTFERVAVLLETAELVNILGSELEESAEKALSIKALHSLLCAKDVGVRLATVRLISSYVRAKPLELSKVLHELHSSSAIYISEATSPVRDESKHRECLVGVHGYVHALAIVLKDLSFVKVGVPWVFLEQLFATGKMLIAMSQETRAALSSELQFLSFELFCEAGWLLMDSLISIGLDWSGSKVRQLLLLWKDFLGSKPQLSELEDSRQLNSEIHVRSTAITSLLSFIRHFREQLSREPVKPIFSMLGNTLNFLQMLKKSDLLTRPDELNSIIIKSSVALESALFECFLELPPENYSNRFVVLLQLAVSSLTGKYCWRNTLSAKMLDSDYYELLKSSLFELALTWKDRYGPNYLSDLIQQRSLENPKSEQITLPLEEDISTEVPVEIRVVNSAIRIVAHLFFFQSPIRQQKLQDHFFMVVEHILNQGVKTSNALSNISSTLLKILNMKVEKNYSFGLMESAACDKQQFNLKILKTSVELAVALLRSDDLNRHAAAQAIGLLCKSEGESFTKKIIERCEKISQHGDDDSLIGYCLVLASIHKHNGALNTLKYLNLTLSALESLSKRSSGDSRRWVLYCTWVVIDAVGLSLSGSFDKILNLLLNQVSKDESLEWRYMNIDFSFLVSRFLLSIFETFGPELIGNNERMNSCLAVWRHVRFPTAIEDVDLQTRTVIVKTVQQMLILYSHGYCDLHYDEFISILLEQVDFLPFSSTLFLAWLQCIRHCFLIFPTFIVSSNLDHLFFEVIDATYLNFRQTDITNEVMSTFDSLVESLSEIHVLREFRLVESVTLYSRLPISNVTERRFSSANGELPKNGINDSDESEIMDNESMVSTSNSIRYHTKLFAMKYFIRILRFLTKSESSCHHNPKNLRKKNCLIYYIRDLVRFLCRACLSNQSTFQTEGLKGLEALFELYCHVPDTQDPDKKYLELFQVEITSALRALISNEADPCTRIFALSLLPEIIDLEVITDKDCIRRLQTPLITPLSNDRSNMDSWIENYNIGIILDVMIGSLSAYVRILSICHEPSLSCTDKSFVKPNRFCQTLLSVMLEEKSFIHRKLLDLLTDFLIVSTFTPNSLHCFDARFFNQIELAFISDSVIPHIGYLLKGASFLREEVAASLDDRELSTNDCVLFVVSMHFIIMSSHKDKDLDNAQLRPLLPSRSKVAVCCLEIISTVSVPFVISLEDSEVFVVLDEILSTFSLLINGLASQPTLFSPLQNSLFSITKRIDQSHLLLSDNLLKKLAFLYVRILKHEVANHSCNLDKDLAVAVRGAIRLCTYVIGNETPLNALVLILTKSVCDTLSKFDSLTSCLDEFVELASNTSYNFSTDVAKWMWDLHRLECEKGNYQKSASLLKALFTMTFIKGVVYDNPYSIIEALCFTLKSEVAEFRRSAYSIVKEVTDISDVSVRKKVICSFIPPILSSAINSTDNEDIVNSMNALSSFLYEFEIPSERITFFSIIIRFLIQALNSMESTSKPTFSLDALDVLCSMATTFGDEFKSALAILGSESQGVFERALREKSRNEKKSSTANPKLSNQGYLDSHLDKKKLKRKIKSKK